MGRLAKLTPHQKHDALKARAAGGAIQADLARRFNVGQGTISRLAASTPATLPNRTNRVDLTIQSPGHLVNRMISKEPNGPPMMISRRASGKPPIPTFAI
jgi:hypothetical protein